MSYDQIPLKELETIRSLTEPFKVVFDVGARDDVDLIDIFPDAEMHMFEVNPTFATHLRVAVGDNPRVHVNPYGLGNVEGHFKYSHGTQSLQGGEADSSNAADEFPVKTLDWYIKENNITRIDFLKIDTEGYDFNVLKGGEEAVKLCRYIQYEHWANKQQFHDLLEKDFLMEEVGFRNVLCTRRKPFNTL